MRISPITYNKYPTINKNISNNNVSFGNNYYTLLKKVIYSDIYNAAEAEKVCSELIKSIDNSSLIKTEYFEFMNKIIENSGLKGFLSCLKSPINDANYNDFTQKISKMPVSIAKREKRPVVQVSKQEYSGQLNTILEEIVPAKNLKLVFSDWKSFANSRIEFYLTRNGNLGVYQVCEHSYIRKEFYKNSGDLRFHATSYMGDRQDSSYYNKDGSRSILKNLFLKK